MIDEDHEICLKDRSVLQRNRNRARIAVSRDSVSADLFVIQLVFYLGAIIGFSFGTAEVKGAYMKSVLIKRDILVRPRSSISERTARRDGESENTYSVC